LVDDDVMQLLGKGSALIAGLVDPDGRPYALRAWAVLPVGPEDGRVRVAMGDECHIVGDWILGTRAAVTGGDVSTLESIQIKGEVVSWSSEPTDSDLAAVAAHTEALHLAIHETDGDPLELVQRLSPTHLVTVELVIDEAYDQTPGPKAGAPVVAH
jgi:hypothetical protein